MYRIFKKHDGKVHAARLVYRNGEVKTLCGKKFLRTDGITETSETFFSVDCDSCWRSNNEEKEPVEKEKEVQKDCSLAEKITDLRYRIKQLEKENSRLVGDNMRLANEKSEETFKYDHASLNGIILKDKVEIQNKIIEEFKKTITASEYDNLCKVAGVSWY